MDKHEDVRISAWLDGELGAGDAREVEAHLETCASCREVADSLESLSHRFAKHEEPDPSFVVRFRQRQEEQSIAPWWTWRQFALRLVPVAAALFIAATATVWMSTPEDSGDVARPDLVRVELEALGNPVAFEPLPIGPPEAVLSIAFEPFPEDLP